MPTDNENLLPATMETHTCHYPDADVIDSVAAMNDPELVKFTKSEKATAKGRADTLVVNLFAGPGAGKSTTAAGVFFELKTRGVNCEIAAEFAKDLTWEERHRTFTDQIYIFGKQYHRIQRLMGQVSVIITDSPLLLTPVYDSEKRPTLEKLAVEEHNKMWTYNAFLKRKKPFNPKGRIHGEEHAKEVDYAVADMLLKHDILFETFDGTTEGKDAIVKKILMLLEWKEKGE
jgi:hypothetical protein